MQLTPRSLAALALVLSLAIVGFVLFSQYGQGYEPCELCLRERLPWYAVIAVALIGTIFPSRWFVLLIAVLLLVSAGLGGHHSGVEQHWWPGPTACTGSGTSGASSVDELRAMMMHQKVVQCDAISWTFLGLSMATYNFLVSLIAGLALLALALRGRHAR